MADAFIWYLNISIEAERGLMITATFKQRGQLGILVIAHNIPYVISFSLNVWIRLHSFNFFLFIYFGIK